MIFGKSTILPAAIIHQAMVAKIAVKNTTVRAGVAGYGSGAMTQRNQLVVRQLAFMRERTIVAHGAGSSQKIFVAQFAVFIDAFEQGLDIDFRYVWQRRIDSVIVFGE